MILGGESREETLACNERVRARMRELPPLQSVPPEAIRRSGEEGNGLFGPLELAPEARWEVAGGVRVRVFEHGGGRGTYLHVHGGGWTIGGAQYDDPFLSRLAREAELAVASVEYRLAPEHPYPAGLDDCLAAVRGLPALALPEPYAIGGGSSGAHLAVLTMLRLRGEVAFAAANLLYGIYDLSGTPSRRAYRDDLVLTDASMEWFAANFLPGRDAEARRDPDVSPLYADLRGLPRALFTVGTLDPLLDDSLFMEARWRAAGNESELRVHEAGSHAFDAFPIAIARDAELAQIRFLAAAFP